ncbi:MAG: indole-3-glycerol-phosphate synthase, partial [Candidatus Diapherotrites archaeon]|nr:indole-3-glycerol-phosphate synthase [Candidatus Diapherotrites archaeon]
SKHAQAISVLTDEKYFQGKLEYVQQVKGATALPVLQKDFIIDEYQIYEARAAGADAILLIAAGLTKEKLRKLHLVARGIGLQCLVEVRSGDDVDKALAARAEIVGINNRDLATLKVDLRTTACLRNMLPEEKTIVSESGFNSAKDIEAVKGKVDAVLIGSALMKAQDIEAKLLELGF